MRSAVILLAFLAFMLSGSCKAHTVDAHPVKIDGKTLRLDGIDTPETDQTCLNEDGEPYPIRHPAPTLGQSSREVLSRILGLTATDLDRLEAAGVTGEAPIPLTARKPRSSALIYEAAAGADAS